MKSDNKKLRVVVMTQNDTFFIPKNILKASKACELLEIVEVDCKHSLDNKIDDYLKWFGFFQCAKMGVVSITRKIQGIVDRIFGYKIWNGECSVKSIAKALKVDYSVINDSNAPDFVQHIKDISPDLIISYSAPQIIKEELLSVPKHGIINVHGSLLPDYRGCLPSFWYLYNSEKTGGASVHYMSKKIDDGGIIKQGTTDLSDCKTMFQLMKKTKKLGGELMVAAIKDIESGNVEEKPNDSSAGRYFTWPTVEQAKEFKQRGYRLI